MGVMTEFFIGAELFYTKDNCANPEEESNYKTDNSLLTERFQVVAMTIAGQEKRALYTFPELFTQIGDIQAYKIANTNTRQWIAEKHLPLCIV